METNQQHKLYRSETDKVISGVCGGLGEFFEVDSTIIRLIFALLAFGGGLGIALYIILMIIVPTKSTVGDNAKDTIKNNAEKVTNDIKENAEKFSKNAHRYQSQGRMWAGIILLALGFLWLLENFNIISGFNLGKLWPIVLIVIGLMILGKKNGSD